MKRIGFLLLFCLTLVGSPKQIIIIPEAEGPKEHLDTPVGPYGPLLGQGISAQGQRRAASLVEYFFHKGILFFGENVGLVAAYKGDFRTVETVAPLANAFYPKKAPISIFTYLPMNIQLYSTQELKKLKEDLAKIDGENVIICWKKEEIPSLFLSLFPNLKDNGSFQQAFKDKQVADYFIYVATPLHFAVYKQNNF